MVRSGWYNESYRHFLAAKGVKTGRGFFVGKGNLESGAVKRILATPKKDAAGNIVRDPFTGRPVYPTKAELGVPYAPKPQGPDISNPEVRARLQQEVVGLQQKYAMQRPESIPGVMPGAAMETLAPEPIPEVPQIEMAAPQLRPGVPIDISDNVDAEMQAVREYNTGAFDTAVEMGDRRVPPSELHAMPTPSVPPEPTSILEDTAGMQP